MSDHPGYGFDSRTGLVENEEDRYCPQHGNINNPWGNCPVAYEDSPEDAVSCNWFVQEMDRRIQEVTDKGNYFTLLPREQPGEPRRMQEYRNHEPYGEPQILGAEK